jgi:hypothetical protein
MNPALEALRTNVYALLNAIDRCSDVKHPLPALVLIYSGVDVLASLERIPPEGTRASFTRWTDKHLLSSGKLTCTSLELYAARCGVLHSFSADSDLYRDGKVRRLMYAWGTSKKGELDELARRQGRTDVVGIHLDDLRNEFRRALGEYFLQVGDDEARTLLVLQNAGSWLMNVDGELVRNYLQPPSGRADV